MQLCAKTMEFMSNILGQFGCAYVREWNATLGMNTNEGRDHEEYEKYVFGSLLP